MRLPWVGVRMYLGRGTMTMWFISENKRVHFREQEGSFNGTKNATGCIQQLLSAARGFYLLNAKVQLYYNNVGKNWYTQTRFYRFVKAISA